MLDQLSERLQGVLSGVRSRGKLTEDDLDATLREIRLALLEADVNFKVVKDFTAVAARAPRRGRDLRGAQPRPGGGQGRQRGADRADGRRRGRDLAFASTAPTVILMAGLQGSGKTTACAKLGKLLAQGRQERRARRLRPPAPRRDRPAADARRAGRGPRLRAGGRDATRSRSPSGRSTGPRSEGRDVLIVDTAGRLHVDEELMDELADVRKAVKPHNVLLVVDAMTGQDAVNVAESFAEAAEFDGVVITKLDGDARGGAALSVRAVTGKPILYASTGEKLDELERFHPDRMAGAHPRHGRRDVADREDRRASSTHDRGRGPREEDPQPDLHARRLPQADAADPQHGPDRQPDEDDPRHGRGDEADEATSTSARSTASRRSSSR